MGESMDRVTAELRDWAIVEVYGSKIVYGKIYGDARNRFSDGTQVKTSKIVDRADDVIITRNSVYRLIGDSIGD